MSARVYWMILSLYPAELRRDFGAEMAQVFLEDLENTYRRSGYRGAARVWWNSIKELCRIVLPVEASKREVAVPFLTYILQIVYLGGVMLLAHGDPGSELPKSFGQALLLAMVFSLAPAFIAFAALRIGNRSVPVPLNLSGR